MCVNARFCCTRLTFFSEMNAEAIAFSGMKMNGTIPSEFGQTALASLKIFDTSVKGLLPSELGLLSETLRELNVTGSNVTGGIPNEWMSLTQLRELFQVVVVACSGRC